MAEGMTEREDGESGGGGGGGGELGEIIRERRLIEGRLLFEEIRYITLNVPFP